MNRREDLATLEWWRVGCHEAGHAVVSVAYDLPLHDARIWLERPRWRDPIGRGRVSVAPNDGMAEIADAATGRYVVACLAGPEAEALWFHLHEGYSLDHARHAVYASNRDGDVAKLAEQMQYDPSLTLDAVSSAAHEVVGELWHSIRQVAALLCEHGQLSADQIREAA